MNPVAATRTQDAGAQTAPLTMSVGALSVTGKVREENQDRMSRTQTPLGDLYIVADGMGGYKGGATAAQVTVETIERSMASMQQGTTPEEALRTAIQLANEEVHRQAQSGGAEFKGMGSTVVALLMQKHKAYVAHVGDSRAYLIHEGKLRQLTTDHTKVQEMLAGGMLTKEEAHDHPESSVLSRAIGPKPQVEPQIEPPLELRQGDAVLLCSDGLSGYIENAEIEKALGGETRVQTIAERLVQLAMDTGGEDNITVQYARYEPSAAAVDAGKHVKAPPNGTPWTVRKSTLAVAGIAAAAASFASGFYLARAPGREVAAVAVPAPSTQASPVDKPAGTDDPLAAERERAIAAEKNLQDQIDRLSRQPRANNSSSPPPVAKAVHKPPPPVANARGSSRTNPGNKGTGGAASSGAAGQNAAKPSAAGPVQPSAVTPEQTAPVTPPAAPAAVPQTPPAAPQETPPPAPQQTPPPAPQQAPPAFE